MEKLYGLDEENEQMDCDEMDVVDDPKPKRRPFAYWKVGNKEYKLKLTTAQIRKLEDKYRRNLISLLLLRGEIPPLSIMLTVIQAAAAPWNNNVKYKHIEAAFDRYTEDGGTQLTLFTDVIVDGVMTVSGFFTPDQQEEMGEKVKDIKENI